MTDRHNDVLPVLTVPDVVEPTLGAHDLVICTGDEEFYAHCACGKSFGSLEPNRSLDVYGRRWERHLMTEVPEGSAFGD